MKTDERRRDVLGTPYTEYEPMYFATSLLLHNMSFTTIITHFFFKSVWTYFGFSTKSQVNCTSLPKDYFRLFAD